MSRSDGAARLFGPDGQVALVTGASRGAGFVTGQVLAVDGGLSAVM